MSLYLALNIGSFLIPFIYSFEKRMYYIKDWKAIFLSITIVAIPFLIWDVYFTQEGVWGFNPEYLIGVNIVNLPLEEVLFFFCIPYASIFTHYALRYFFPKIKLSAKTTKVITWILLIFGISVLVYGYPRMYTTYNFTLFICLMLYALFVSSEELQTFYLSFIIILIPFFLVNGILTGSFIEGEVVWYNNAENLGIRMFTIPFEDMFYAFNMLYPAVVLIEKLKPVFRKRQNLHFV